MKTSFPKPAEPKWVIVDATDQVVGRLATKIATVLRGRNKASFVPHWECGDHVIVTNAAKIKTTVAKSEQKTYYRHTGWLGHLRSVTMKELLVKDPTKILKHAVKGMLPKNLTREHTLKRLHIYAGPEHKHEANQPSPFPL